MKLHRYLKESQVVLKLTTCPLYPGEARVPEVEQDRVRAGVIDEFTAVFDACGVVSNAKKLGDDLLARERRTSTALGGHIAFPHVRTQQARRFVLAIGRSPRGLPFGAFDGQLVHLFVAMIAPPHADKEFLKVEQALATAFSASDELYREVISAQTTGEVVRAFSRLR
jgi:mannitol/fructose-specific phosphotransferase system IIA component (Ntr-type)